jgi:hypothetical protein
MSTMTIGNRAGHEAHIYKALRVAGLALALAAALALAFWIGTAYQAGLSGQATAGSASEAAAGSAAGASSGVAGWTDAGAGLPRGAVHSTQREQVWRDAGAADGVRP